MKPAEDSLDLPRLIETDPGLADELALLKTQLPDASELALMASRLQLQGIDVAATPAAQTASAAPWQKWLLGAGGAVTVGLGLWALAPAKPAGSAGGVSSHSSAIPAAPSAPTPANIPRQGPRAPRPEAAVVQPGPVMGAAPFVAEVAAPSAAAPASDSPTLTPRRTVALQPSAPRDAEPGAASLSAAGGAGGGRVSSAANLPSADAPTEIGLLREARLALKRSPATALELTEQHTHTYPSGKLVQERELIAVSALIALGRRTAALGRAARFEQAFPQSPYRKQLAELLR